MTESSSRFNALDNPVEDYNHKQNKNTRAKTGIDFPGDYLRHLIFSNIYLQALVEGDKMLWLYNQIFTFRLIERLTFSYFQSPFFLIGNNVCFETVHRLKEGLKLKLTWTAAISQNVRVLPPSANWRESLSRTAANSNDRKPDSIYPKCFCPNRERFVRKISKFLETERAAAPPPPPPTPRPLRLWHFFRMVNCSLRSLLFWLSASRRCFLIAEYLCSSMRFRTWKWWTIHRNVHRRKPRASSKLLSLIFILNF